MESGTNYHERTSEMTWTVIDECPKCGRSPARIDATRFVEGRGRYERVGFEDIECEFGCHHLERLDRLTVNELMKQLEGEEESLRDELRVGLRLSRFAT